MNFFRGWSDYVGGFGDLSGEFWLGELVMTHGAARHHGKQVKSEPDAGRSGSSSGLESLHNLTSAARMSLRVDLRVGDQQAYAEYSKFEVSRRFYRLTVGGYSGTAGEDLVLLVCLTSWIPCFTPPPPPSSPSPLCLSVSGDSLSYHNNRAFSTKDRDRSSLITRCAMSYRGGWWYRNCHEANLNGLYGVHLQHKVTPPDDVTPEG